MKDLLEKYPEQFKKLGGIIYALNKIDVFLITTLSTFFIDESDVQSEKNFIFNDALFDKDIFPEFENRLRLFMKAIDGVDRVAKETNKPFDKQKWLDIVSQIRKVQRLRNELAHHFLVFPNKKGGVAYQKRKSSGERLQHRVEGKKGTIKYIEINLDEKLDEVQKILELSEKLPRFNAEAIKIISNKHGGN